MVRKSNRSISFRDCQQYYMTGQTEKDEKAGIEQHVVRFFQSDGHEYASSASSAESQEREQVASLPLRIKRWFQRTQSPAQEHQEKQGLDTAAEEPNFVSKVKGIFKKSPADHADHRSSTAAITRTPTTSDSTGSRSTSLEENIVTKPSQADFPWYQGGVRLRHIRVLRFVGRCGFIAKGIIYGIIGVLTCTNVTGAWTPNGSNSNESPQVNQKKKKTLGLSLVIGLTEEECMTLIGSVFATRWYPRRWTAHLGGDGHWLGHVYHLAVLGSLHRPRHGRHHEQ